MKTIATNYNSLFFLLVLFVAAGCNKDENETPQHLRGTWIETVHKTDTLEFSESDLFILNRGMEMQGEYLLPKPHSGPYFYEIERDSILLIWGLSSSSYGISYYFEYDEQNEMIRIGNFFVDSLSRNNETLDFLRVN